MLESVIGPGLRRETDDIEWELCCSSREASAQYTAFANLDLVKLTRAVADSQIELKGVERREVRHLVRFGCTERLLGTGPPCDLKSHESD